MRQFEIINPKELQMAHAPKHPAQEHHHIAAAHHHAARIIIIRPNIITRAGNTRTPGIARALLTNIANKLTNILQQLTLILRNRASAVTAGNSEA